MLKKFKDYIKENILDNADDIDSWSVEINDKLESSWLYKIDAIERIISILNKNPELDELYQDDEEKNDIIDELIDLDESDFYEELDKLKDKVEYSEDIKLINIADDDELEFLKK
jgi:hypothetical protein